MLSALYANTSTKISPIAAAQTKRKRWGLRRAEAPFFVADAPASLVVTVDVCGASVVPGIVLAASVVVTVPIVLPLATIGLVVVTETMLGGTVVPEIVVVYVISWPSAVAGIALPLPEAVY